MVDFRRRKRNSLTKTKGEYKFLTSFVIIIVHALDRSLTLSSSTISVFDDA